MKFIVDMNLSPDWVRFLEEGDIAAQHWSSLGDPTSPDLEIMQYARKHGYAILTHDLDFASLLALTGANGPSVVQIRSGDAFPSTIAKQVIEAIGQSSSQLNEGAILTVEPQRYRATLLPISRQT